MTFVLAIIIALLIGALLGWAVVKRSTRQLKRERFIRGYVFAPSTLASLQSAYPHLQPKDHYLIARAMRSFFLIHLRATHGPVAMPSKVVDALWHAFILDTRAYQAFCDQAFGSFFHHTPAAQMRPGLSGEEAMRRTWRLACLDDNIPPKEALRLPLLFAIDAKLKIPDGNSYALGPPSKTNTDGGVSGGAAFACSGDGLAGGGGDGASACGGSGCGGGCGGS